MKTKNIKMGNLELLDGYEGLCSVEIVWRLACRSAYQLITFGDINTSFYTYTRRNCSEGHSIIVK